MSASTVNNREMVASMIHREYMLLAKIHALDLSDLNQRSK
jgi:hypothetical protein